MLLLIKMVKKLLILIIKFWQVSFSPQSGIFKLFYSSPILSLSFSGKHGCRFKPRCSEYTKEALEKYPLQTALKMSAKRIARCHPFGETKINDPLIKKQQ